MKSSSTLSFLSSWAYQFVVFVIICKCSHSEVVAFSHQLGECQAKPETHAQGNDIAHDSGIAATRITECFPYLLKGQLSISKFNQR